MGTADTGFFHDGPDGELYPFFTPEGAVELKKYGHVDGCGDGPQLVQLPVQPEACQLGNEGWFFGGFHGLISSLQMLFGVL